MIELFCICIFTLLILFHVIFYHKYHLPKYVKTIEKIPGPKGFIYFGNALQFYKLKPEEMLEHISNELNVWGPTMRYWFSGIAAVLISDADDIQTILNSKLCHGKGFLYELLRPWLGTGLLTSEGSKWETMRKLILPAFRFSILQEQVKVFEKNGKIMMEVLEHKNRKCCNLSSFFTYCSLDSLCETSMGKCINLQRLSGNDYVKAILRMGQIIRERLFSPLLYPNYIFKLSRLGRENTELLKTLHGVTTKLVMEHKKRKIQEDDVDQVEGPSKTQFLDLLLEKQKIHNFSDEDVREEVDSMLMAGHDTISAALTWCFFELGHNAVIQEKVHKEMDDIFKGSNRDPTYKDLMKMEYLKRVLQESLRLYPSVPVISRKSAVDIKLKNYLIPANTDIVLLIYHIQRNPKIFENPEAFDPDRFLSDAFSKRNKFAFIPFSGGLRNCIGQRYAMLQMLMSSSFLLRKYKIKSLNPKESVKPIPDVILRPSVELLWELTERRQG